MQARDIDADIAGFENPLKVIEKDTEYNLYLLDVEMTEIDGLTLAGRLREKFGEKPDIIFVTAYEQVVFDTFKYSPLDFVRKEYLEKELPEVLERFVKKWLEKPSVIEIKTKDGVVCIEETEVLYVESIGHYLVVHCIDNQYTTRIKMKEIIKDIKPQNFIRTHKSYLVNRRYICRLDKDSVILTDAQVVPVSRRNKKTVSEEFFRYINNNR
jgi:DNA-binding LytR/AlgR family response regulator